jgi:hypothetical protein
MPNPTQTVGTTAVQILAAGQREVVAVTNLSSSADLFIGWDASASNVTTSAGANAGTLIPPRGTFTLGSTFQELRVSRNAIWAIASAAGTPVAIQFF